MHNILLLISILTFNNYQEPQIGYWVCDAIKQEKNVDLVILPAVDDIFNLNDTLIIAAIAHKELNQLISNKLKLPNIMPIAGFTIAIDNNIVTIKPYISKINYSLITTKSFCPSTGTIINDKIKDIFLSYLNKSDEYLLPQSSRYQIYQSNLQETENREMQKMTTESININYASQTELEKLPGIGPKLAQKIIDYRKQNGLFKNLQEIMQVNGIGPKRYEAIKHLIKI